MMRPLSDEAEEIAGFYLMIAAGGVFTEPTSVQTVLGSCVTVTFHCPARKVGGIFHALLPSASGYSREDSARTPFKFVDSAILAIIGGLERLGVRRSGLEAKVFGGSSGLVDDGIGVGRRNVETAFATLERCRVHVKAADVGGRRGRKILFMTHTGDVFVKKLGQDEVVE